MKHKKTHDKIIIITFAVALSIIILFGSLNFMIFNKEFYYKEYSKNQVYDALPAGIDVEDITENVMRYFRGRAELQYFTTDEKSHMNDVKHLIRTMQLVYYGAAIIIIGLFFYSYKRFRGDKFEFIMMLSKSLLYSSVSTMIFLALLFLMTVFSFELLFTIFHLILFPQGNWMFESSSLLITLFPERFFSDIALRIFVYAIFQATIFLGIGYWMHKQLKIFERYR